MNQLARMYETYCTIRVTGTQVASEKSKLQLLRASGRKIDTYVYDTCNRHSVRVVSPKTLENFNSRFTYVPTGRARRRGARNSYLIN